MNKNSRKFKLIIGLGNPGNEYAKTWHNAGFMVIDKLKLSLEYQFNEVNKKGYDLITFPSLDLQLLKPLTYMNNSGTVLTNLLKYNEYKAEDILIVFDDLDLKLGEYKLQQGKFPKVHNGLNSIHEKTGKKSFYYLRIGTETRDEIMRSRIAGEKYVLQKPDKKQSEKLAEIIKNAVKEIVDIYEA